MESLTVILLIGAVGFYVASILIRHSEVHWLSLIVSVCGLCALIIDPVFESDTTSMILLLIPYVYIVLMSTMRIMGLTETRGRR